MEVSALESRAWRIAHSGLDLDQAFTAFDELLRPPVRYAIASWSTHDPASGLFTSCTMSGAPKDPVGEARYSSNAACGSRTRSASPSTPRRITGKPSTAGWGSRAGPNSLRCCSSSNTTRECGATYRQVHTGDFWRCGPLKVRSLHRLPVPVPAISCGKGLPSVAGPRSGWPRLSRNGSLQLSTHHRGHGSAAVGGRQR
jgi:hypothetical protein